MNALNRMWRKAEARERPFDADRFAMQGQPVRRGGFLRGMTWRALAGGVVFGAILFGGLRLIMGAA